MIENNRYLWNHLKTKNIMVRVNPRVEQLGVVFKVSSMVDVGRGRQMVVLDQVDEGSSHKSKASFPGNSVPFRMGNLDFVYTSRQNPIVQNVDALLGYLFRGVRMEKIVTDVLAPGDIMIFRQESKGKKFNMVDVFRIVRDDMTMQGKAGYAV